MACKYFKTEEGIIGIACSSEKDVCAVCGKAAVAYCDVCDLPLCKKHTHKIAFDTDVCPEHNTEEGIRMAVARRKALEKEEKEH